METAREARAKRTSTMAITGIANFAAARLTETATIRGLSITAMVPAANAGIAAARLTETAHTVPAKSMNTDDVLVPMAPNKHGTGKHCLGARPPSA